MKYYRVLYIKEFGGVGEPPNAVYISSSYWVSEERAREFYGSCFVKLLDDNYIEV